MASNMKKLIISLFLIIAVQISFSEPTISEKSYKFGFLFSEQRQDQRLKPILEDLFKYISASENINMEMVWLTDEAKFMDAIKKKEFDFAYAKEHDPFIEMVVKHGYEPVVAFSGFGKKKIRVCIYTHEDRDVKSMDDLRGLKLIAYSTRDGYFPLRKMIGNEKPEDFFGEILISENGMNSLNRLLAGESDIAMSYDSNLNFLKMGNPSIVKKLKELMCGPAEYSPGITIGSKDISEVFVNKIKIAMEGAHKSEEMKKYRGLMKSTKLRFVPVTKKDYKSLFALYEEAKEKGWEKDYLEWVASVVEKEK